ncbi:MAG: hypothetical protein K5666_04145, partial [Bacilli bacterium]|nr:hypothetical protein [Bacilli bacterium]
MEDRVITKRLSKDRVIKFNMVPGYVQTYLIKETILEHEVPVMNYQLAMWDDFNFNCWINCSYEEEQELKEVTFDFDLDHPLYIPFLHLLRGDKELIIDDDDTYEDKMKYMVIRNEGDVIKLSFINNL